MIVRVLGVGQFRLSGDDVKVVRTADLALERAIAEGDEEAFTEALTRLSYEIERVGEPIPIDEFVASDVVVPDPETTLAEAATYLGDDGAIPG